MGEKPTAAMVLSLIGGIIMLLVAAVIAAASSFVPSIVGGGVLLLGIVGILFGLIVIIGSIMMYQNPQSHTLWGVVILVLAIVDLPGFWGFGLGSLLAFIGGILAIVFKPSMAPMPFMPGQQMGSYPMGPPPMGTAPPMGAPTGMPMFCKNCGASIPPGAAKCPSCGASVM